MLVTFVLTFIVCFLVMSFFLPRMYERAFLEQFDKLVFELVRDLENAPREEVLNLITVFAFENHANVSLEIGDEEIRATSNLGHEMETTDSLWIGLFFTHSVTGEFQSLNVEVSKQPIYRIIDIITDIWIYLFFLTIFIFATFSWLSVRKLTKPVIEISKMSKKMQQLDLKARCHLNQDDEIGELAYNLNEMANELDRSLDSLQSANLLLKEREEQQKNFFMAVSHELKTPLTVLRTQLDGMIKQIGDYQDRDLYLNRAYETTGRMSELIDKLLSIIQMQSNEISLREKIDIGKLMEEICLDYEKFAEHKGVSLTNFCQGNVMISANRNQLQLAFFNILSNGIIHSVKGGLVDVQVEADGSCGTLKVENYGSKINEEDLKHIFDPFYRTDKSRSRYTGGSGLGLYIVKNILELHGFEYHLTNSENGVVFCVKFPLVD